MADSAVAIVTGAGRPWGLGRATALGLARKGMNIAVVDIREDWGKDTVGAIKKDTGRDAIFVRTDVAQKAQVEAMVQDVVRRFGRIDVLCNIAAITSAPVMLENVTEDFIDRIIGVNLKGTIFTCQAVVPVMRRQGGGRIVNTSSLQGYRTMAGRTIYAASKLGESAFSRGLAWEVAQDNIIVNVAAPGHLNNAMGRDGPPDPGPLTAGGPIPFTQAMLPADVAEVIVLLATQSTAAISGQTIQANKGEYMV